jgi:Ferritin-like domain
MLTISTKDGARIDNRSAAQIATVLTTLLADTLALYVKVKNFHWHVSGPHFRDYHLLLDDQATQIFAMTDPIAERASWGTRRFAQSDRLRACSASWTAITCSLRPLCKRPMRCAMSAATWPPRACWKTGSTKPKAEPGFCSRPPTELESGVSF